MDERIAFPLRDCIGRMIRTELKAAFTDCDAYGHVASAKYLEMAINHRMSAVTTQLGFDTLAAARGEGFAMINKEITLDYRASAQFDDPLVIESWIDEIKRMRMFVKVRIRHRDTAQVFCMVTLMSVAIDPRETMPIPFPELFSPLPGVDPRQLPFAPGHPKQG